MGARRQRFHSSCAALIALGKATTSDASINKPFLLRPNPPWGYMPSWSVATADSFNPIRPERHLSQCSNSVAIGGRADIAGARSK